ncbi:hypothetical protein M758_3G269100 [Ceratodon purpureus]|nr:hypothetical protein M758_3G269100 [Ceratodon purpureus]
MFTATRVTCGIPGTEYARIPLQVSTFPVRGALTATSTNSSENMAVIAESMSSNEYASISRFKWSGGVNLVLNCNLNAAWSLQADFLGLSNWVPSVSVCRLVDGEPNAVGCLRYCKGSGTTWVHERLLEFDNANHYMSYRMEDNHFVFPEGFKGYVAKVQLGDAGEGKTWVKWTYEVDPVVTQTKEELTVFMVGFYTLNLQYLETGANKLVIDSKTNEAAGSLSMSAFTNSEE